MESKVQNWLEEVINNAESIESGYSKRAIAVALSTCITFINNIMVDNESVAIDFKHQAEDTYKLIKVILLEGKEK